MTRTTKEILTEANQISTPDSGARVPAGKEGICTVRCNSLPPASAVTEAKVEPGVAAKCIKQQVYGDGDGKFTSNSNPKKRDDNTFGIGRKSNDNEKDLK